MPRTSVLLSVANAGYGFWDDNVAVAYRGDSSIAGAGVGELCVLARLARVISGPSVL